MHGVPRARNRLTKPFPWHNRTKILDKLVKCDWEKPCKTITILLPVSKMDPSWQEGEPDHRQSFHLSRPEMFLLLLLNNIITKRMLSLKKDYNWAVLQVKNLLGSQDIFMKERLMRRIFLQHTKNSVPDNQGSTFQRKQTLDLPICT